MSTDLILEPAAAPPSPPLPVDDTTPNNSTTNAAHQDPNAHRASRAGLQTPISAPSVGGEPPPPPPPPTTSTALPVSKPSDVAETSTIAGVTATEGVDFPVWLDWQDMDIDNMGGDILQFEPEPTSPNRVLGGFEMTKLLLADLNQLYFDRVHAVLPMIHRRHYFSWADQENPSHARACLRSAMHTVAAAMSAQYRGLAEALCQETRWLLETHPPRVQTRNSYSGTSWRTSRNTSPKPSVADNVTLELVQAWLLVAHYEFLRVDEHQAMLTAGRAFRLVQLARLYDVDGGAEDTPLDSVDDRTGGDNLALIIAEEKRRTFWLTFSFDRFLCSRNEWPLTLQEEAVRTRLPAPEASFQNSQPTRVIFLSEALAMTTTQSISSTVAPLSPFAECVVLAALNGRCMTHRRVSLASASPDEGQDFWARHTWLVSAVDKRVQFLSQSPSIKAIDHDPMILFTHMLAHRAVIYLSSTLETAPWKEQQQKGGLQLSAASDKWRAERAAGEMVRLAESARSLGCFGVHPFIADPLACATEFFIQHTQPKSSRNLGSLGDNGSGNVESLLSVLRNLRDVNILARDYLSTLEADYSTWCAENMAAWLPASKVTPLKVGPAPYPTPGPNQIVVKNCALGINSVDWAKQMLGEGLLGHIQYPIILGSDVSGTVAEVGEGVKRFRVSDRVVAASASIVSNNAAEGGFQQYTLVREWLAAPIPDKISHESASALPLSLLTASHGLFNPGYLGLDLPVVPKRSSSDGKTTRTVIITGGASVVGSTAIQLAVSAGYEVVSTASSKNFDYVKKLGAAHVFDYKSATIVDDICAAIKGRPVAGGFSIGDGSADLLTAVLAKHEGPATNKFIALAGGTNKDDNKDTSVEVKFILLGPDTIGPDSTVRHIYEDYLPRALAEGQFVPSPEPQVVGKGLEKIQDAFMIHMQGVSAKKIVVTL
ncbi:hypothetical protein F5Y04DRAFT_285170 [Hypomontagnella monticulosa]|nr:hypothetical protein F5Y04DRAFT_285170 [Hypomontagnella monticulosa]